jgi:dihydrofolate reductase
MTTTLYMAISADGFIAGPNDETPWSDESWDAFRKFVKSCDIVLFGRRTYKIMRDHNEFVDGPEYRVATDNEAFDTGTFGKLSIKTKADLPQVERLGVIGGGDLNGCLAELNAFDALGSGTRLFGNHAARLNLELLESQKIGKGTLHNRYLVREGLS